MTDIFRQADMLLASSLDRACVWFIAANVEFIPQEELADVLRLDSFIKCIIEFLQKDEQVEITL